MFTPTQVPKAHHPVAHMLPAYQAPNKAAEADLPPPQNSRKASPRLRQGSALQEVEQRRQVRYQVTRAAQMSEPVTFKNSTAAF